MKICAGEPLALLITYPLSSGLRKVSQTRLVWRPWLALLKHVTPVAISPGEGLSVPAAAQAYESGEAVLVDPRCRSQPHLIGRLLEAGPAQLHLS